MASVAKERNPHTRLSPKYQAVVCITSGQSEPPEASEYSERAEF